MISFVVKIFSRELDTKISVVQLEGIMPGQQDGAVFNQCLHAWLIIAEFTPATSASTRTGRG